MIPDLNGQNQNNIIPNIFNVADNNDTMSPELLTQNQCSRQTNIVQKLYSAVDNNDVMTLKKMLNDVDDEFMKKSIFKIEYYFIF